MGKLIDEDILIDSIPDLSVFEQEDFGTPDMIRLIEDAPTVQAISKADYEKRLKADLVAMLTELQLEIVELKSYESVDGQDLVMLADIGILFQQKINALKAESEADNGNDN